MPEGVHCTAARSLAASFIRFSQNNRIPAGTFSASCDMGVVIKGQPSPAKLFLVLKLPLLLESQQMLGALQSINLLILLLIATMLEVTGLCGDPNILSAAVSDDGDYDYRPRAYVRCRARH